MKVYNHKLKLIFIEFTEIYNIFIRCLDKTKNLIYIYEYPYLLINQS